MKIIVSSALVLSLLSLTACGGGGGGGGSNGGTGPAAGAPTFNSLVAENLTFYQKYSADGDLSDNVTPVANMPRSGTASYKGAAMIWAGEDISSELENPQMSDVDAASRMNMTANMSTGAVRGNFSEFKAAPGRQAISGQVDFDGRISENGFRADSDGTVTIGGTAMQSRGIVQGVFIGPRAGEVSGLGAGNLGANQEYFMIYSGKQE